MAQEYNAILPSGSTNILQDNIDSRKNDEALRSGFSGSAFPTSPIPIAGQRCYREDLKKEYIFNGEGWVEVASSGAIAQEVTLARGTHTKLQDRLGVSINPDGTLKTPATANVDEFKVSGFEPTYVSTNSFSVPGDMRAIFTENRRLKITQGVDTIYPAVVSASYDDVSDKTTIVIDNITITNEIAAVDYSLVQYGLPLASETVAGAVELATSAEVLAGEDTERAVTPKGLSDWSKIPVGAIITYPVDSIPSHCLECNGAEISRGTYPELFAVIGETYGAGDGSTTFNIPDLRGEFIRGLDNGRGVDAGRGIGSPQMDAFQGHGHYGGALIWAGGTGDIVVSGAGYERRVYNETAGTVVMGHGTPRVSDETRPRNVAMMYCIVYE